MSQSRLTINIQCSYVSNWGSTLDFLRKLDPCAVVACIDNMNALNRVLELQRTLPQAQVIGRFVFPNDGGMHMKPQAAGDNRQYIVSPLNAIDAWHELGINGRMLYLLNEPMANGASQNDIKRLSDWMLEAIKIASERKVSLCLGNFGVGHPMLMGNGEYDARFDDVLTALSKNRDTMALGMHVYQPADTFTRLDGLIKRCKSLGITPPRVHITEAGFDAAGDGSPLNGYKTRGYSGKQFADFLIDKVKNVYSSYIADDVLQSIAVFCWGNDASWSAFNVENDADWKATIQEAKDKGLLSIGTKVPQPNYTPDAFVTGDSYRVTTPGAYANIRSAPSISSSIMGQVDSNSIVTVYGETLVGSEYWREIKYGAIRGYLSMQGGAVKLSPYYPEPPVVIPPPVIEETVTVTFTKAEYTAWLAFRAAMERAAVQTLSVKVDAAA